MGKQLRKFNRATHRDLGYFFVAMILIYAISGIAINHINDWDPSYTVDVSIEDVSGITKQDLTKTKIKNLLETWNINKPYRKHYFPDNNNCKIFVKNGNILINIPAQKARIEVVNRRTLFHVVNWLHYNPNSIWKWFSDIFAGGLIILAISGMFILRGKNGLKWRGTIIIAFGILVPIIFIALFYL